jgi:hypothetical protein
MSAIVDSAEVRVGGGVYMTPDRWLMKVDDRAEIVAPNPYLSASPAPGRSSADDRAPPMPI